MVHRSANFWQYCAKVKNFNSFSGVPAAYQWQVMSAYVGVMVTGILNTISLIHLWRSFDFEAFSYLASSAPERFTGHHINNTMTGVELLTLQ